MFFARSFLLTTRYILFVPTYKSFWLVVWEKIVKLQSSWNKKWPLWPRFLPRSRWNEELLWVTSLAWFALTTKSFGRVISEQKIFQVSSNQKQEFPWSCFSPDKDIMKNFGKDLTNRNIVPTKFGSNLHSSFRADDQNVKSLHTGRWMDPKWFNF